MQTLFTDEQLSNPEIADANVNLRKCVHCGFCTATCPTYVLLGDEADSPRGRIYMIKEMLEKGEAATAETVKHIDRCLSCLSCMTTCPSGVNYMHLVDHAREHIEKTYQRPWADRALRSLLAFTMVRPSLFRLSLMAARLGKFAAPLLPPRLRAMLNLVPKVTKADNTLGQPGTYPALGAEKGRVALLKGCVQSVIDPEINAATIRMLNRIGFTVVVSGGESCCGSLPHHMGKEQDARARAKRSIDQWLEAKVDAVIITASGCGTTIKDYGHMFRDDPAYAAKAKAISAQACDITEFLVRQILPAAQVKMRVAYHSACSLQHGQQVKAAPQALLRQMGFEVVEPAESHMCCGSAGTYNILQPEIAAQLRDRKLANLAVLNADIIASGNIGCSTQLASGTSIPVVHTVQLLDWATGGPKPEKL
jgi:glycolate oxidase iron-sulfur subunit